MIEILILFVILVVVFIAKLRASPLPIARDYTPLACVSQADIVPIMPFEHDDVPPTVVIPIVAPPSDAQPIAVTPIVAPPSVARKKKVAFNPKIEVRSYNINNGDIVDQSVRKL
jgi:hypothetical protein